MMDNTITITTTTTTTTTITTTSTTTTTTTTTTTLLLLLLYYYYYYYHYYYYYYYYYYHYYYYYYPLVSRPCSASPESCLIFASGLARDLLEICESLVPSKGNLGRGRRIVGHGGSRGSR